MHQPTDENKSQRRASATDLALRRIRGSAGQLIRASDLEGVSPASASKALARLTEQGGRLALAGLLAGQVGEVRAAYAPWFELEAPEEDEGWALVSGVRR